MHYGRSRFFVAALITLAGGVAAATEMVPVPGSQNRYPTLIEVPVAGRPTRLVLTGAAVRRKAVFSVYTIASYVQEGTKVQGGGQLPAADVAKLLHLVMERDVSGEDMAAAIRAGIRLNHPGDAFAAELSQFDGFFKAQSLRKGDHVVLTAVPGAGLRCQVIGKTDVLVPSAAFARAVWEIYFGRNNLGEPLKAALSARL